jgi:tetratricopeptide (TPR) repeat protein
MEVVMRLPNLRARPGVLAAAAAALALLAGLTGPARADGPEDNRALAARAHALLKTYCYRCHGQDGANEGGLNYILDRDKLVSRKKLLLGDPDRSRLFKRLTSADEPMPPAEEKLRPSSEDRRLLRAWIAAGAPAVGPLPARRAFLPPADVLRAIRADLETVPERGRRFTRYFTLTHLHNAGLSADELQSYRHALAKLVNSLSWGASIVVPRPVDPAGTVLRIDLRDFQWNEKVWDAVLAANPYGIVFPGEDAAACAAATGCRQPFVRGDWFVAAASRPPLYHEVLQLPATLPELERLLRVDTAEDIRQEKVARAGFNSSGVSRNNRLIERHESGGVVFWLSYDFAGNVGPRNLFAHPLGPGDGEAAFRHDGGEVIFTLPNGLHAYLLADAAGRRLDKGPAAIVSDPRRPDRAVENGISCMSCHARGLIAKDDQVRAHVLNNPGAFAAADRDTVLALYPPRDHFAALLRQDTRRFQEAVAMTRAPLSASEPVVALALHFEAELGLPLAAAEAGVRPEELLRALDRSPRLARQLGVLRVSGATVQRQAFTAAFAELVRVLRLGEHLRPRNTPAARSLARAEELLDRGDVPAALREYDDAIGQEPDNPVARNNRGLAYLEAGDHGRALADFSEAIRLDPDYAVAYYNRGQARRRRGQPDGAVADFTRALELRPDYVLARQARAAVFHQREEYDRAIADLNEVIRLEPRSAVAHNNRGLAHYAKRDHARAVADYGEAIRLDAKLARAYYNRSLAHREQGDEAAAEADRRRAIELDPTLDKE